MRNVLLIGGFLGCLLSAAAAQPEIPGLPAGTQAPDFESVAITGEPLVLSDVYEKGPVVLIFYRGGWCHYCNLQLQDYQKQSRKFASLGATVIAVSVDLADKARAFAREKQLDMIIVSDPEAALLEKYNAVFQVSEETAELYKTKYHIDLEEHSGRSDRVIAVPATYVIDQSGQIRYSHSDYDYKVRKKAQEILDVIRQMGPAE